MLNPVQKILVMYTSSSVSFFLRLALMKPSHKIIFIYTIIIQETICRLVNLPFSLKKYDQNDILLEEEDKRDLLQDIKTVYAPEYRIYTNGSIGAQMGKEKREICRYYNYQEFMNKCTKKKIKTTIMPKNKDDQIQIAKNSILETYNVDENLLDSSDSKHWINYTNYVNMGEGQPQDLNMGMERNLTNTSSLDLSVFWHSDMDTQQIRKLQGSP